MNKLINDFDYFNADAQKYWAFPSSYTKEKKQNELYTILYSDNYVASEKKDGYWQMFIKDMDGELTMRARSKGVKGWVTKQDWVPHLHSFFTALPKGTVLIGEVYLEGKTSRSVTTILGCGCEKAIQRQEGANKLLLSVFDILAWNGMSIHTFPIKERLQFLEKVRIIAANFSYVNVVEYWETPEEIHSNWLRILAEGGEGVVLTKKSQPYEFGKRTARGTLKLKKELEETIDVFLTGRWKKPTKEYSGTSLETWQYWYKELDGTRLMGNLSEISSLNDLTPVTRLWYNNWAAAIEVATNLNGKVVPVGYISGIPDEVREGIVNKPDEWVGKVVELQAMEINQEQENIALRHAKIVNWRTDKTAADCVWH